MIRQTVFLGAVLVMAGCSEPSDAVPPAESSTIEAAGPLTAADVQALIESDGAAGTWAILTRQGDEARLEALYDGLGTGDAEWLALVPQLQPAADGYYAEGLQEALFHALPNNAAGVLALMPDHAGTDFVCRPAGVPPGPDEEAKQAADIAALQAVTDPALAERRDACLDAIGA